jgi:outer membrane protein
MHWTLRQCTEYAVSHNIQIKQRDNQRIQREIQLSTAKNSRLPDLSGSVSERFSFGRGLTVDNTYTNRSTSSTSFSIGTNVPLFTGFKIPNNIKLNQLNLEAATQDLEKAKNDIRMQVAKAFVQILYDMEIADVAVRQVEIDSMQVARLERFLENGKASGADVSQQKATLAQSQLTATQAQNNLHLALLVLTQLLELPTPEGFSIVRPNLNNQNILNIPSDPNIIYQEALLFKPEVKAEQLRLDASEKNIKIAQAALYPTLSLTGGLQSNYNTISGVPSDGFFSQLKNNFSQYIGLSLNVPIFNRFSTRNSIRSARIDRENQQLQLDNIKKTLYKEIQQVYYNAVAAQAKYESSEVARQSSEDAFTLTQAKYENGKANITEFNEAKNRYLKAESDLVQARYEYLYQTSLLDFYRGKELNF